MIIEKGHGTLNSLIGFLNKSESRIVFVCGNYHSLKIAKNIENKIDIEISIIRVEDNIKSIDETLSKLNYNDVIIGIGGGKLMDLSKEIAFRKSLKLVLFPTIISNDGLANGLVVLNSINNSKSIYRKSADYIFIDFDIIEAAPKKYLQSAIGDIFSNYSAINDFEINKGKYSPEDFYRAKYSVINSLSIIESINDLEVDKVVGAIIESGKSVEILKDSSAISGSEHLILHSLEKLYPNINVNHGIAVAAITLFTLFIQNKLQPTHFNILSKFGIDTMFLASCNISEIEYPILFELSKEYRFGRKTILNNFTNKKLTDLLVIFLNR